MSGLNQGGDQHHLLGPCHCIKMFLKLSFKQVNFKQPLQFIFAVADGAFNNKWDLENFAQKM